MSSSMRSSSSRSQALGFFSSTSSIPWSRRRYCDCFWRNTDDMCCTLVASAVWAFRAAIVSWNESVRARIASVVWSARRATSCDARRKSCVMVSVIDSMCRFCALVSANDGRRCCACRRSSSCSLGIRSATAASISSAASTQCGGRSTATWSEGRAASKYTSPGAPDSSGSDVLLGAIESRIDRKKSVRERVTPSASAALPSGAPAYGRGPPPAVLAAAIADRVEDRALRGVGVSVASAAQGPHRQACAAAHDETATVGAAANGGTASAPAPWSGCTSGTGAGVDRLRTTAQAPSLVQHRGAAGLWSAHPRT